MLTPATPKDIKKVFNWRNSPGIMSMGNGQKVSWTEHAQWFNSVLSDKNKLLLIIDECGTVRLEREGKQCEISVYVSEHMRGQGLGKAAIKEATRLAFVTWDVDEVFARVKWDNMTSNYMFRSCSYIPNGDIFASYFVLVNREK